jgi:DNA-binding transcriptional ArsR family regulator
MSETDTGTDTDRAPEEVFSLLGNETRVAILRALWDAHKTAATFSELYDAVGMNDTGQFNYHLGKLVGTFVKKSEEGYKLAFAGEQVIGAVLSGVYTETGNIDPIDIGDPCHRCGGQLRAHYSDEHLRIECDDCEMFVTEFGVPPGVLDGRNRADLPHVFNQWIKSEYIQVLSGFCPACTGPITTTIDSDPNELFRTISINHECERCSRNVASDIGAAFIDHPAIVQFHDEHGIDLRTTPLWQVGWLFEDHATIVSEDPLRIRITATIDDDTLSLLADDDLTIIEVDIEQ